MTIKTPHRVYNYRRSKMSGLGGCGLMINKIGFLSNIQNLQKNNQSQNCAVNLHSQPMTDVFVKNTGALSFGNNNKFNIVAFDDNFKRAKSLDVSEKKADAEKLYRANWKQITVFIKESTEDKKITNPAFALRYANLAHEYACNLLYQGKMKEGAMILAEAHKTAVDSFEVPEKYFDKVEDLAKECDLDLSILSRDEDDDDFDVAEDSLLNELKSQSEEPHEEFDELSLLKNIRHEYKKEFDEKSVIASILPAAPDDPIGAMDEFGEIEANIASIMGEMPETIAQKPKVKASISEIEKMSHDSKYHELANLSLNGGDDLTVKYPISLLATKAKYNYDAKIELIRVVKEHEKPEIRQLAKEKIKQTYSID